MQPEIAPPDADLRHRVIDSFGPLLSRVLRREVGDLSEGTRLRDELGLTSASTLELMLELEDKLAIEIDVEELDEANVQSVGALADYVITHSRLAG